MPLWLLGLLKWAFAHVAPTVGGWLGLPDLKKLAAQASVYYGAFLGLCLWLKLGWMSPVYAAAFTLVPVVGRGVERFNAGKVAAPVSSGTGA